MSVIHISNKSVRVLEVVCHINAPLLSLVPTLAFAAVPHVLVASVLVTTGIFAGINQEMRFVLFSKVSAFLLAATLISGERLHLGARYFYIVQVHRGRQRGGRESGLYLQW